MRIPARQISGPYLKPTTCLAKKDVPTGKGPLQISICSCPRTTTTLKTISESQSRAFLEYAAIFKDWVSIPQWAIHFKKKDNNMSSRIMDASILYWPWMQFQNSGGHVWIFQRGCSFSHIENEGYFCRQHHLLCN